MPFVDGENDGARLCGVYLFHAQNRIEWNCDTDFLVFSSFCPRHLDENGRNLYNNVCICSQNMCRQGTYFTKKKVTHASACGTRFLFY